MDEKDRVTATIPRAASIPHCAPLRRTAAAIPSGTSASRSALRPTEEV
jgi:hypothetical protein